MNKSQPKPKPPSFESPPPVSVEPQPAPIINQPQQNNLAIVGFILAFFVNIAGLIVSIFALKKSKQLNGHHRGLAIAGIIISSVSILLQIIVFLLLFVGIFWLIPKPKQVVNADQALRSIEVIEHRFDDLSDDWRPTDDIVENYFYRPTSADSCQYYRSQLPVDRSEVPSGAWRQFQDKQVDGTLSFSLINNYLLAKNCGDWKLVETAILSPAISDDSYWDNPPPPTDTYQVDSDNSRRADINQIATAINVYIATNNKLPTQWSDINAVVLHYDDAKTNNQSINVPHTASNNRPETAGDFTWGGLFGAATTAQQVQLYPATSGQFDIDQVNEDLLVIVATAKCVPSDSHGGQVEPGGQLQMAVVYKLEADDWITCHDIWPPLWSISNLETTTV